jgi:transposase
MEAILSVYTWAYNPNWPVVCMDETSKQLIGEVRLPLPAAPGKPARYDYEYERHGVANLFMFFEPLGGWRQVKVTERRTKRDWALAIRELVDGPYRHTEGIVLVLDNLNTHTPAALYETFEPQEARRLLDRLEIHYTPKHGSWLNMAELELSILTTQCLDQRIPDAATLQRAVTAWEERRNARGACTSWRFTAEDARIKLRRLYPSIDA